MYNSLLWLVNLVLVTLYAIVAYLALHPNVPMEYRLYYLEDKLEDWPGYGGLNVQPGDTLYFSATRQNSVRHRGSGWEDSTGQRSCLGREPAMLYLRFRHGDAAPLMLQVTLQGAQSGAETIGVEINQRRVGDLTPVARASSDLRLRIEEPIAPVSGLWEIAFHRERAAGATSRICFSSVRFSPARE